MTNLLKYILIGLFSSSSLLSVVVKATNHQDLGAIQEAVKIHVESQQSSLYGDSIADSDIEIHVGRIDPRLKLSNCQDNLSLAMQSNNYGNRNVSVKVNCSTGSQWSIFIPVSIDIYRNITVSNTILNKGDIIDADLLALQRVNTSSLSQNYVEDKTRLIGMEVRRRIQAGTIIKLSDVKKTNLVLKGDSVELSYRTNTMTVSATGKALTNGYLGQRIRVLNTGSKRIVDAKVVAYGKTEVR